MKKNISGIYLIQFIKELKDCLFLLMVIQQVTIKFLMIPLKNIFFQELKLKTRTSKLMEETFMISQLMTRLSNTMKSEKYQQDKVMITRLVVCWIWKELQTNCSWFKQTKSFKCWFKSNSTNYFSWQNKINSSKYKSNNQLHSRTIQRNSLTIFERNSKSIVTAYKCLNTAKWMLNCQIHN